ncbi:MAG: MarR family transcriptional regulator [Aeromicrobium sp.]
MEPKDQELNIGVLMFVSYRHIENAALKAVADAGFEDITLSQARILQRIGREGTRLTNLAEHAQVTKQSAGVLVDQLEAAGYVERVADPSDGRARLVRFTPRGRDGVAAAGTAVEVVEREWVAHVGERRMAALREALTSLREIADPYR